MAANTVSVTADEAAAALTASPEYAAEILWLPTLNVETLTVAVLPTTLTAVPRLTPLSLNCTVPEGPSPLTVAVKVTVSPTVILPADADSDTAVLTSTVCRSAAEALG